MTRDVDACQQCGKTILPEEIEIGGSLICPRCAPKLTELQGEAPPRPTEVSDGKPPKA